MRALVALGELLARAALISQREADDFALLDGVYYKRLKSMNRLYEDLEAEYVHLHSFPGRLQGDFGSTCGSIGSTCGSIPARTSSTSGGDSGTVTYQRCLSPETLACVGG